MIEQPAVRAISFIPRSAAIRQRARWPPPTMLDRTSNMPGVDTPDGQRDRRLRVILAVVLVATALLATLVPLLLVLTAPPVDVAKTRIVRPKKIVPKAVVPEVEPVALQEVSENEAVAFNDTVPFSIDPNPAARPFRFGGSDADHERAVDCLAAAVLYEAGDDHESQQAVAQVVLNRARHPAFPSSICGVVFQGSERRTGCQFTFTCDGALTRRYSQPYWDRARKTATAAIDGDVFAAVGEATHYHTNWVVPYWSSSLDKIVAVKTHLFFRWTGWWGTPPAFSRAKSGTEPMVAKLAAMFDAHGGATDGDAAIGTLAAEDVPETALPTAIQADTNTFITALDPRMSPDQYPALAQRVCQDRSYCKFLAWSDAKAVPTVAAANLPADSPALQSMSFSYLRDRSRRFEKPLWNCDQNQRKLDAECMRRRIPRAVQQVSGSFTGPPPVVPAGSTGSVKPPPVLAPTGLNGVRRKPEAPAPTPSPSPTAKSSKPAATIPTVQ